MNRPNYEKVDKLLKDLIRKLNLYVRGVNVNSEEILSLLHRLLEQDEFNKIIVDNKLLGLNLFKELRKYIPTHINRIDQSLKELLLASEIPIYIVRWLYNAFEKGQIRITTLVRIPGITTNYFQRGLQRLKSKAIHIKSNVHRKKTKHILLKKMLVRKMFLDKLAKQELSQELLKLIWKNQSLDIASSFLVMSEEEFVARLLAIIKFRFQGVLP